MHDTILTGQRKRSIAPSSFRKRAPRPTPATSHHGTLTELEIDPNEPRYCICNQVSFGDMVACDGENVSNERERPNRHVM